MQMSFDTKRDILKFIDAAVVRKRYEMSWVFVQNISFLHQFSERDLIFDTIHK